MVEGGKTLHSIFRSIPRNSWLSKINSLQNFQSCQWSVLVQETSACPHWELLNTDTKNKVNAEVLCNRLCVVYQQSNLISCCCGWLLLWEKGLQISESIRATVGITHEQFRGGLREGVRKSPVMLAVTLWTRLWVVFQQKRSLQ